MHLIPLCSTFWPLYSVNFMNLKVGILSRVSHHTTVTTSAEYALCFYNLDRPQGQSIKPGAEMETVSYGTAPDYGLAKTCCLPLQVIPTCPSQFLSSVRLRQHVDEPDCPLGHTCVFIFQNPLRFQKLSLEHKPPEGSTCITFIESWFSLKGVVMFAHTQQKGLP